MKALTISQPYASLIADGEKFVENRTWQTNHRGLIAIHAGKGTQYLNAAEMRAQKLPVGQIVAVAVLVACVEVRASPTSGLNLLVLSDYNEEELRRLHDCSPSMSGHQILRHKHTEGPWCWVLQYVRKLSTPIDCSGAQGLWNVPTEIEELLMSDEGTAVAEPEVDEVVADSDSPEQAESVPLSELERSHYDEIRKLEELASEAEEEFDSVNAQAKALKKRWEGKVEVLRSVIRRGVNPQRSLPFSDDEDEQPEAWRIVAIDTVLDLSDKQATLLQEAGILTVEQFENLRAGEGLTSLAGVGQTTADKWEDQVLTWLAANAREVDEPEDDDEPADED